MPCPACGRDAMKDELLRILACPVCKQGLSGKGDRLVCNGCGREFPVRDGIPVMLPDESPPPADTRGKA